jgi:large subunit ribosomal protein L13Ae
MIPHKTPRGAQALARLAVIRFSRHKPLINYKFLQTYEGIPEPYDKQKRVVIPAALKVLRMRPDRRFTVLGELSKEVGWGYTDLVARLEAQRKIKEQAYYAEKKAKIATKEKAAASADLSAVAPTLESFGY